MSTPVQSIDRVFDILEELSSKPQGLTLSELSFRVGLHSSTTHRLVNMLASRGYAYQSPESKRYMLTLRMFEVGHRVSYLWDIVSVARPFLDDLASLTKEAIHLVERDGSDVVYLYKAEPYQPLVRMTSSVGRRNPMYCTGVGKAIMAFLPALEMRAAWEMAEVTAVTHNTITDYTKLFMELAEVRKRGYALDNEENEIGVRCVAAPIFRWDGYPVAAVSISAPVKRMNVQAATEFAPHLIELADKVSSLLGERRRK